MSSKRKFNVKRAGASKKRKTITLELKLDIIERYEGGATLSTIARDVNMAVSTINTIVKDKDRIKECTKGCAPVKSTTKQRTRFIHEMDELLTLWIEHQNQRHIPLSLVLIQEKAKSLYEDLKAKKGVTEGSFVVSHGWFQRFKARTDLHIVNINGDFVSADSHNVHGEAPSADSHHDHGEAPSADSHHDHGEAVSADSRNDHGEAVSADSRNDHGEAVSADSRNVHGEAASDDSRNVHGEAASDDSRNVHGEAASADSHSDHGEAPSADSHHDHGEAASADSHSDHGETMSADSHNDHGEVASADLHSDHGEAASADSHSDHGETLSADSRNDHGEAPSADSHHDHGEAASADSHSDHGETMSADSHNDHGEVASADLHSDHGEAASADSHSDHGETLSADSRNDHGEAPSADSRNVKITGDAASANEKAGKEFPEVLAQIIDEGGYLPEQVFNVDETGLFWKKMPDRTYIAKEEKTTPGFKAAKDRLTLLLGGNAKGDFKLKPLLVYHAENPQAFKGISKGSLPVVWMSNKKAWVTLDIFEDWFWYHMLPQLKEYCREKAIPFKILLLLDNAPGHPQFLDDFHPDVKVVYMPPNITSLLQPMDQGVIATFKALYLRRMFSQAIVATEGEDGKTLREFWKGYNVHDAVKNITGSWAEVKMTNMNGVWKKLCPQFVHDINFKDSTETVDDVVRKVVDSAHQLQLEVEVADVEMLLESHAEELSNDDLMELEAQKAAEEISLDGAAIVEPPKRFATKDLAEAFKHFDAGLVALERMDPNAERFANVSRIIQDGLACYKMIYYEKKRAAVHSTLDLFVKKVHKPTESPIPEPSTSATPTPSTSSTCKSPSHFIVKVKVESEFEFVDVLASQLKDESHPVKIECVQSDVLQTFPEVLNKDRVKQEPCDSPLKKSNDPAPLLESELHQLKTDNFQDDVLQTSQDALSDRHKKKEPCDSLPRETSNTVQPLKKKEMKPVSCSNCSQLFDAEDFNQHMTRNACQDTDAFRSVSCKRCTVTLKNIQGSERPHKCSVCGKVYPSVSELKIHQREHTSEKPFTCPLCNKTFAYSSYFKKHQRRHTREKPFKCSVCQKAFYRSTYLKKHHRRLHSGEKAHTCSVCSKAFTYMSQLKSHLMIHTGEKPHKCSVCSKELTRSSDLHIHQRIHTGEKPYKCSLCPKAFIHSSNFRRHQRIHTREKPYKCSVCSEAFAFISKLKTHERVHTRDETFTFSV